MSKTFGALIRPNTIDAVHSKYVLEGTFKNDETEVDEVWSFSVNADVAVPTFHSNGAETSPATYSLTGTYDSTAKQIAGFDRFTGSIGGGRFYLRTGLGVVVKGAIGGGPPQGQSFVGSGTWLKS